MMIFTIVSVNFFNREDTSLFGYKLYIVLSDSMKQEFEVGDIAVSKEVDASLKEGDIITFKSIDPESYGEVFTHKIRNITTYKGNLAYTTYGTTTNKNDEYPVLAKDVIGQYAFRLPKMGYFFQFLKTPLGYLTIIFIPMLLLLIMQLFSFFRLVRKLKVEQQEELEALEAKIQELKKMLTYLHNV